MRICLNSVDFPDSPDPSVRQKIKEEEERTEKKKHEPQGSGAREEISRETCVSRACSGVKRAFWLWPASGAAFIEGVTAFFLVAARFLQPLGRVWLGEYYSDWREFSSPPLAKLVQHPEFSSLNFHTIPSGKNNLTYFMAC